MADYRQYIAQTKLAEGGLSKAKTDSASKYPVPDGKGYHTNKGITWKTFEKYGPILGYEPTPELFYEMPDWIWEGIFKAFWAVVNANLINSTSIANILFQSVWGGGSGELVRDAQRFLNSNGSKLKVDGDCGPKTVEAINAFTKTKAHEKAMFDYLYLERLAYLQGLDDWEDNGAGWLARMQKFYKNNQIVVNTIGVGFLFPLLLR